MGSQRHNPHMEAHLMAGMAIFNAGYRHAAHDAWEEHWLELSSGTQDERLLHGLIQYTAAMHHAEEGNWSGCQGLASSAGEYLEDLPAEYRGVSLAPLRNYLSLVASDPVHVERSSPPKIRYHGAALELATLDRRAAVIAAPILAEAIDGYDHEIVADAAAYAQSALDGGQPDRFVTLLSDFVADPERRGLIYDRLVSHVNRRRAVNADVDNVFEP